MAQLAALSALVDQLKAKVRGRCAQGLDQLQTVTNAQLSDEQALAQAIRDESSQEFSVALARAAEEQTIANGGAALVQSEIRSCAPAGG